MSEDVERQPVTLHVNGTTHRLEVEPRETLADVLRDVLRLTGVHLGCEHGVCGACTVSVDGLPTRSCIGYAVQFDGCDVRTVEGVQDEPAVAALRDGFQRHHGLQCGFCTPGYLMLGRWFAGCSDDPAPEEITDIVSSNICRCGCYEGIRKAYLDAARAGAAASQAGREP